NNANFNRPWGYNAYQGNWAGWHSGNWDNWSSCPSAWYGAGLASGYASDWMYDTGTPYTYSNPFYVEPTTYAVDPSLNYAQPIEVPSSAPVNVQTYVEAPATTTTTDQSTTTQSPPQYGQQAASSPPAASPPPAEEAADNVPPEAVENFDAARAAFKAED